VERLGDFYSVPAVRRRLAEYCGGDDAAPGRFSSQYLVGYGAELQDGGGAAPYRSFPREEFPALLGRGLDLFRSVWDRESTLGVLDLEFVHHRRPGEALRRPREVFEKIEPVYQAVQKTFYRFNITPLAILTGQGYHFSFRVRQDSPAHARLEALGHVGETLAGKYANTHGRRREPVPSSAARAYDGMGRLMEYVGHMVLRELRKRHATAVPVTFTDVAVGGDGEAVVLDFSMYGDPVYMRDVRCPFSGYQKHKVQPWKVSEDVSRAVPVQVALPRVADGGRREWSLEDLLERRSDFARCADMAEHCRADIPDASHAAVNLVDSYTRSALYRFHMDFDAVRPDPREDWDRTYRAFRPDGLPPCVAHCLQEPNDNLLKPTNLQSLTRVLMKRGWHPRHIAGLVWSKYEQEGVWSLDWRKYDTETHANFFVRLFAGLLSDGMDGEQDLNCVSHAEKGYCWRPACGSNLAEERLV
jgi:hypothetical protein